MSNLHGSALPPLRLPLLIADYWWMARRYAARIGQGALRGLGPGYC